MIDLAALVLTCAPLVAQDTARALIQVESGGNPFANGVVGGALVRQPANLPEALATVAALEAAGVTVVERVAHELPANPHNQHYLATKRDRAGHLLR